MSKKSRQRQKTIDPLVQKTGMVAGLFLVFVSFAAAYQSPAVKTLVHAFQNGSALNRVAGKVLEQDADSDRDDPDQKQGLKPEDEDKGGDDSLKFKKREYAFRAYPNKTIPAGARERAWEQFQAHYPPGQKKSPWKPMKQVSKP